MTARDVMNPSVKAAKPTAVGRDLAFQLVQVKHSGLPVVDATNRIIGMITTGDLLHAIHGGKNLRTLKAQDIMTAPVTTVREDESLASVIDKMNSDGIVCLPVEGENEALVGIITQFDILRHLLDPFIEHFDHPAFVNVRS